MNVSIISSMLIFIFPSLFKLLFISRLCKKLYAILPNNFPIMNPINSIIIETTKLVNTSEKFVVIFSVISITLSVTAIILS